MLIEAFVAQAAVERFDIGVLIRLAQLDLAQLDAAFVGPCRRAFPQNSLPLPVRMILGKPRVSARRSSTRVMVGMPMTT